MILVVLTDAWFLTENGSFLGNHVTVPSFCWNLQNKHTNSSSSSNMCLCKYIDD